MISIIEEQQSIKLTKKKRRELYDAFRRWTEESINESDEFIKPNKNSVDAQKEMK